jgi:hypothetical protein
MTETKPTKYLKEIIEISDYMFANPWANRRDILAKFGKKWRISTRTFDRIYKDAKAHKKTRLQKQEQIKDRVLTEQTKEVAGKDILSRMEALEILAKIAKGNARKLPVRTILDGERTKAVEWEMQYPSDGERTKAVSQLAKMEGWETPQKIDLDIQQPIIIQKNYVRPNAETNASV